MKTNQRQWLATGFFSFVRRCPVQRVSHTVLHWRHCSKPNGTYESSTRGSVCHTPSRKWLRAYVRTYVHAHTHTHTTTMVWKPMRPLLLFPSSHSPLLVPRHGSSYYFYYFIFPTPKAHTRIRTCTHCLCFARSHASATARLVSRRACALQARASPTHFVNSGERYAAALVMMGILSAHALRVMDMCTMWRNRHATAKEIRVL